MTPIAPPRALPLGWVLLIGLAVLGGLELFARHGYHAPGELPRRAAAARASFRDDAIDVVLYGSCLGEQALDHRLIGERLGARGVVHSLAAAATDTMDWFLAQQDLLVPGNLDATVVLYMTGDLVRGPSLWRSQALDLARWSNIRELASWSCSTGDCVAEFYLRRASFFYRYRAYFGNFVWWQAGARAPQKAGTPPEGMRPDGVRADGEAAALHFLERLVRMTVAAEVPIIFIRMPEKDGGHHQPGEEGRWTQYLEGLGAEVAASPKLSPGDYEDGVHLNARGRTVFSQAVAAIVATVIDERAGG